MSRDDAFLEDNCSVCAASCTARNVVDQAIAGDKHLGQGVTIRWVEEALEALEQCRRHRCDAHRHEDDARARLQEIVDECLAQDEAFYAEQDRKERAHAAE